MKCLDKKRIKLKGGESLSLNERHMLNLVSSEVCTRLHSTPHATLLIPFWQPSLIFTNLSCAASYYILRRFGKKDCPFAVFQTGGKNLQETGKKPDFSRFLPLVFWTGFFHGFFSSSQSLVYYLWIKNMVILKIFAYSKWNLLNDNKIHLK